MLVVVEKKIGPGESLDQDYVSSTGDRADLLDAVELKFLSDDLPTIPGNMPAYGQEERLVSIPSSIGPGLSVHINQGNLKAEEAAFGEAILVKV